jgi:hypothetical protein
MEVVTIGAGMACIVFVALNRIEQFTHSRQ